MKVGILGGGLSGLTLGYLMSQKNTEFEILEKESSPGGLMRSIESDGYVFDYGGSHIVFSKDKEVMDFILNLLGDNKIRNKRNTKVLYGGNYVKYPFENGLSDLPMEDNYECLMTFLHNHIKKEKGELSPPRNLREWCYYNFGLGISEKYLLPYNEKIWKFPPERTALDWVERIPQPPLADIIKSSLGISTEGYIHQLYFYYPLTGGIQEIVRALSKDISQSVRPDFEVKHISKGHHGWLVSNGDVDVHFDRLISTIPVHELITALDGVPLKVINAVNNLKYNSLITIGVGINGAKLPDLSWLYIPDKEILTHRISFPSGYSTGTVPPGKSSILAEITCNYGDALWNLSDDKLIDKTIDDLNRLNIISKGDVSFTVLKRLKYAYVINDLDYQKNLTIVSEFLKSQGIDSVGRFAEFQYLNMDGCIRNAIDYFENNFMGKL
jgi:protoporphyrinogen oxidase